jgi:hypothetical protein
LHSLATIDGGLLINYVIISQVHSANSYFAHASEVYKLPSYPGVFVGLSSHF